jgi:hypothetical protein
LLGRVNAGAGAASLDVNAYILMLTHVFFGQFLGEGLD